MMSSRRSFARVVRWTVLSLAVTVLSAAWTMTPGQAAEQVVIRMYSGFERTETIIDEYLRLYEKLNPHVKIENLGSEWDVSKLTTLFVAGTAPDIIQHSDEYIQQMYREGFLSPVPTDLASRMAQKFYPVLIAALTYNGRLAGVPTENMVTGLWYNEERLDEAGIASMPQTLDDLERVGLRLTRFAGDGRRERPGLVEHGEWWSFNQFGWTMFKALGGQVFDQDGNLRLDGQPMRDLLTVVPRWIGPKGFMSQGWDQLTRFFKGEIPYGFGYLWWSGIIKENYKGDYLQDFGVAAFPKGPGGSGAFHYAHAYGVNARSKNQQEAWKLLEWLSLQPIEGVTPLGHALSTKSLPVNRDDFQSRYYDPYRPWAAGFIANLPGAWSEAQYMSLGIASADVDFATAMWQVRDGATNPAQAIADLVQKVQNRLNEFRRAKK